MSLTLNESSISNTPVYSEMLNDLQANILKHHGREFAYHLFLSIKEDRKMEAKNWIAEFANSNRITSASKQLIDAKNKKDKNLDGGDLYTLSLSSNAYRKLEIDPNLIPENQSFLAGMNQRANWLDDDLSKLENEFQNTIDILIILANSVEATATKSKDELISELAINFNIVKIQKGQKLINEAGIDLEHFGYADGISQPLFFEDEVSKQNNHIHWKDEARLNIVLVKDKGGKFNDSCGSYLVFRKLEQNVKAFKEAEKNLHQIKDEEGEINGELGGAMIVGRFEDGTEVTNFSIERDVQNPHDLKNDFDYSSDKEGSKCPFHSHIRITNPRADIGATEIDSFVKKVRIVRRGIPFNEIGRVGTEGTPEKGVGLLFMCYQSNIEMQFEFIQREWVNHGKFPDREVGQDGIIGQGSNSFDKKLPIQWGKTTPSKSINFSNSNNGFVTMKGGEYFFTPSISFLQTL